MKTKWIKNDWYSTTLVFSCEKCGEIIYSEVYTIPLTDSIKESEARLKLKKLPNVCPHCGKGV